MTFINKDFIYYFITLKPCDDTEYVQPIMHESGNNNYHATAARNLLFWEALLHLFGSDSSSISLTTFVDKFPQLRADIEKLYPLICDGSVLLFYDINKYLFSLGIQEYTILMSYLEIDELSTPSDWSSISNSDDDEEILAFNINDQVVSPIHVSHPVRFIPPSAYETSPKPSPQVLPVPPEPLSPPSICSPETNKPIMEAPKAIQLYDPTIIPKKEYMTHRKTRKEYSSNKPKYSWYIAYIVQCAEWIQVPNCIKKYF